MLKGEGWEPSVPFAPSPARAHYLAIKATPRKPIIPTAFRPPASLTTTARGVTWYVNGPFGQSA